MLPSPVTTQYVLPSETFPADLKGEQLQSVSEESFLIFCPVRDTSHRIDVVLYLDEIAYVERDDLL